MLVKEAPGLYFAQGHKQPPRWLASYEPYFKTHIYRVTLDKLLSWEPGNLATRSLLCCCLIREIIAITLCFQCKMGQHSCVLNCTRTTAACYVIPELYQVMTVTNSFCVKPRCHHGTLGRSDCLFLLPMFNKLSDYYLRFKPSTSSVSIFAVRVYSAS